MAEATVSACLFIQNNPGEDAVLVMDEVVDSLQLLDYENKFCKVK